MPCGRIGWGKPVFFKKAGKLFFRAQVGMVFFLMLDVIGNPGMQGGAHGKISIAFLP